MSQEEKKQTAPETEAAAEMPETPAQEAPEKEAPQAEEKNEGKHDCKHHHHETAALQAKLEAEEKKNADKKKKYYALRDSHADLQGDAVAAALMRGEDPAALLKAK